MFFIIVYEVFVRVFLIFFIDCGVVVVGFWFLFGGFCLFCYLLLKFGLYFLYFLCFGDDFWCYLLKIGKDREKGKNEVSEFFVLVLVIVIEENRSLGDFLFCIILLDGSFYINK